MSSTTIVMDQWRNRSRPARVCGHVHDTTSRYDHDHKRLSFLLVCPVCATETVIETLDYEPHFEPLATVHQLPAQQDRQPARRAA
jgi:predicted LPLAT superfamily acyltransferase